MKLVLNDQNVEVYFQYDTEEVNNELVYTGVTNCKLMVDGKIHWGYAVTNWQFDQFNKRTGRKIAFGRALRQTNLDKNSRTVLWAKLFPSYKR